ncbi:MAG: cytidylate kinase-like family protein [Singulisphaera sp.]
MAYRIHSEASHGAWNYLRALAYPRDNDLAAAVARNIATPQFTIAISREAGVDAAAVASAVGTTVGWKVWDQELVAAVAACMHTRPSELAPVDETHISWLQESIEALLDMHAVSQTAYVRHLIKTLETLGRDGSCIIVGRGAAHILPAETTLRVRLVAPLEDRVTAQMRATGATNRQETLRAVERMDRARTRFITDYFHRDPNDPANYDLVLNMSRLAIDDCATQIVDALHAEQQHRAHRFRLSAPAPVWH